MTNAITSSLRASSRTPEKPVPTLTISFDREVPRYDGGDWESHYRDTYEAEGDRIAGLLFDHLPGGLYDQLLRAMLQRKASLLVVTHR